MIFFSIAEKKKKGKKIGIKNGREVTLKFLAILLQMFYNKR